MKIIKILCYALLILLGIFLVIFGGYDDSPGAQGLGLLVAGTGLWNLVKVLRKP